MCKVFKQIFSVLISAKECEWQLFEKGWKIIKVDALRAWSIGSFLRVCLYHIEESRASTGLIVELELSPFARRVSRWPSPRRCRQTE